MSDFGAPPERETGDPGGWDLTAYGYQDETNVVPMKPRAPRTRVLPNEDAPHANDQRPVVRYSANAMSACANDVQTILLSKQDDDETLVPLYQYGGALSTPLVENRKSFANQTTKTAHIRAIDEYALTDMLSKLIRFESYNAAVGAWRACRPPKDLVKVLMSRNGNGFKVLTGLIQCQVLRRDGSFINKEGYDPATGLLAFDLPQLGQLPTKYTKQDAANALDILKAPLAGFPFANDASLTVALAMILASVGRAAHPVIPMPVITAPNAGTGKTLLASLPSLISTGRPPAVIAVGYKPEETEKRVIAAMLSGVSQIAIDNVNGELDGDLLCQAVEQPLIKIRPLGSSNTVEIVNQYTITATGNNIEPRGDMCRRVLLCTLDPNVERPELRIFKFNPCEMILADRGKYIAACLTIMRAYRVAGCPGKLAPLASFREWSDLIRSSLVWLGCADPLDTMEAVRANDTTLVKFRALIGTWSRSELRNQASSCSELIDFATRHPDGDFTAALKDIASGKNGFLDPQRLGIYLKRNNGRIVDGMKLMDETDSHTKAKRWLLLDTDALKGAV